MYETRSLCVQDIGLQWLMDKGKVATQEAYPYQGVDNFCTEKGRDHINFDVSPVHTVYHNATTHKSAFRRSMIT